MKTSSYTSLLGISLEHEHVSFMRLVRSNGGYQVRNAGRVRLAVEALTRDPDRLGRDLRTQLDRAGIRERRCVVCLPLAWTFSLQTPLPSLSEADIDSFLSVQAEKEFPLSPDDMKVAVSRYRSVDGSENATVVATNKNRLLALCQALKVAKLRPVRYTIGITSLVSTSQEDGKGQIVLLASRDGIDLAFCWGSHVVALRCFNDAVRADKTRWSVDATLIARQIRITLGQHSKQWGQAFSKVAVFGTPEMVRCMLEDLREPLDRLGLPVEAGELSTEVKVDSANHQDAVNPAMLSVMSRLLAGRPAEFDFLVQPSSRLRQLSGRISSRATLWAVGTVTFLVFVTLLAFLIQHWRLSSLQNQWNAIEARVTEVQALQDKVRQFRPWYDDSIQSLVITEAIVKAFPEEGSVWSKSVEIDNGSEVSIAGSAKSNSAWLDMLDRLRHTAGVKDLKVLQVRGDNPIQFTLNFRWDERLADES